MTTEEAQKVLDELQDVRLELLNDEGKRLFEAIMKIADERDLYKSMLEEKDNKIRQLGKGQQTLMQCRRKWKNRYYKMKKKNKDLQKSVEQIYNDYQDIGKMSFDYSDRIEVLEKQIDLMAEEIDKSMGNICPLADYNYNLNCENECNDDYKKCWKQYFENKAKEVE